MLRSIVCTGVNLCPNISHEVKKNITHFQILCRAFTGISKKTLEDDLNELNSDVQNLLGSFVKSHDGNVNEQDIIQPLFEPSVQRQQQRIPAKKPEFVSTDSAPILLAKPKQSPPETTSVRMACATTMGSIDKEIVLAQQIGTFARRIFDTVGQNFSETVYHRALEVECRLAGIQYASEVTVPIKYRGHVIGHGRADMVVEDKVVVEVKALSRNIDTGCIGQTLSYLNGTGKSIGLVINFCSKGQTLSSTMLPESSIEDHNDATDVNNVIDHRAENSRYFERRQESAQVAIIVPATYRSQLQLDSANGDDMDVVFYNNHETALIQVP